MLASPLGLPFGLSSTGLLFSDDESLTVRRDRAATKQSADVASPK